MNGLTTRLVNNPIKKLIFLKMSTVSERKFSLF